MANQKRIPFIPKQSREFKPMRHYYCETETTAKLISRSVFLRLLAEQPYPMGQVSIDFDGGFAYLFPYDPERAEHMAGIGRNAGKRVSCQGALHYPLFILQFSVGL